MKRCPTCQQSYPDTAPDICPNDGTQLYSDAGQWQQQPPPPPPQGSYNYQAGGGYQPNPPGGGYQPNPPGGGYQPGAYPPPPGQYPPPYGGPMASGGGGLSKAALVTGISAAGALVLGYILIFMGASSLSLGIIQFGLILILLSLVAGLAAVVLGIITLVMASKNPALNKVQGIIGLCLGALPLVLWLIGFAGGYGRRF